MDEPIHNPQCFANHMGLYAIEPNFLRKAVAAIKAGTYPVVQAGAVLDVEEPKPKSRLYELTGEGVAVISVSGPMMKGFSKFPHANTLGVRRSVRAAVRAKDVRAILLLVDSPGGMVAGTQELADDIQAANAETPVYAHIDDLGASAAYWAASQARRVTANRTAEIGSIGVLAVVEDSSKQAEMEGVEVHVVATGPYKGAFAPGVPIEERHLAYLQERVDDIMGHFQEAVRKGRKMGSAQMRAASDGRVFGAEQALGMKLIDEVASLDQALAGIAKDLKGLEKAKRREARAAENSARLAKRTH